MAAWFIEDYSKSGEDKNRDRLLSGETATLVVAGRGALFFVLHDIAVSFIADHVHPSMLATLLPQVSPIYSTSLLATRSMRTKYMTRSRPSISKTQQLWPRCPI